MAKQTVVALTDDIHGSEAAETVEFGIAGQLYSIDLSSEHAEELRDRLTAYREFGTALGRYRVRSAAPAAAKRGIVGAGQVPISASEGAGSSLNTWRRFEGVVLYPG